jgi:DNA-binding phage protein
MKKAGDAMLTHAEALARTRKTRPDLAHADEHPSIRYFLAVNLGLIMHKQKLTQAALAKKAGLSLRCVQGMASPAATTHPTLESVDAVALALGVKVVDLLRTWKETLHV